MPAHYDPNELKEIDALMEALEGTDGRTASTLAACGKMLEELMHSDWLTLPAKMEIRERYHQHCRALGALPISLPIDRPLTRREVDAIKNKIAEVDAA